MLQMWPTRGLLSYKIAHSCNVIQCNATFSHVLDRNMSTENEVIQEYTNYKGVPFTNGNMGYFNTSMNK